VRLFNRLAAVLLLLYPAASAPRRLDMPTELSRRARCGAWRHDLRQTFAELSAGKLQIRPSFDAAAGIRSADMLAAIAADGCRPATLAALSMPKMRFSRCDLPFLATSTPMQALADLGGQYLRSSIAEERPAVAVT